VKDVEDIAGLSPGSSRAAQSLAERWVAENGDYLLRYAIARVRCRETAEDLVQEAFVAAWKSRNRFAGGSSEKTWLCAILRRKIADYFRSSRDDSRSVDVTELADLESQQFSSGWLGAAHWHIPVAPHPWKKPDESMEQAEFWETLDLCVNKLPDTAARVFLLREVEEFSSQQICETLRIQQSHLFVLLYRARLALRRCIELHWFRRSHSPVKR
jgi:RNA polymerase sigma-70 factor (ECF subfamily)